jgi:transmembrane 9 superfamily protein 1
VCRPSKIEHRSLTLGEVLDGDRMAKSMYDIKFGMNVELAKLCNVELSADDLKKLQLAIEDLYYFEFVVGKLCVS